MINLDKTYRTQCGKRVRGLKYQHVDQVMLVNGEHRKTGYKEKRILGETLVDNDWTVMIWDEEGRIVSAGYSGFSPRAGRNFNLVEFTEKKVNQPGLF